MRIRRPRQNRRRHAVNEQLGRHPFDAERTVRGVVVENHRIMRELAGLYDPDAPIQENAAYRDRAKELLDEQVEQFRVRGRGVFHERSERGWTPPSLDVAAAAARQIRKPETAPSIRCGTARR